MLFVLVSNHPDFYLDGPILTSNKKKKIHSKACIVFIKKSFINSILVKSIYDPHCVYLDYLHDLDSDLLCMLYMYNYIYT